MTPDRSGGYLAVKHKTCLEYIHWKRFREFHWPTLEQVNEVRYAYAAPKAFIMGDFDPVFPKNVYVDYKGTDCLLDKFNKKCIDKVQTNPELPIQLLREYLTT
jgi:hypothetical protein